MVALTRSFGKQYAWLDGQYRKPYIALSTARLAAGELPRMGPTGKTSPWGSPGMAVQPRITFAPLSAEARRTAQSAQANYRQQFETLVGFLSAKLRGMTIDELDLWVERPRRAGTIDGYREIAIEWHGPLESGSGERSAYTISCRQDLGVLVTIGDPISRIEEFLRPESIMSAVARLRMR